MTTQIMHHAVQRYVNFKTRFVDLLCRTLASYAAKKIDSKIKGTFLFLVHSLLLL